MAAGTRKTALRPMRVSKAHHGVWVGHASSAATPKMKEPKRMERNHHSGVSLYLRPVSFALGNQSFGSPRDHSRVRIIEPFVDGRTADP